ncbi:MAG TPA: hypothetical protein VGD98_10745 [Ktedonobacteraceae bacterium]
MKKGLCRAFFCLALACGCLLASALPAFAASERSASSVQRARLTTSVHKVKKRNWYLSHQAWRRYAYEGDSRQEINQFRQGNSNHDNPTFTRGGHGQGNSGNYGYNRGHSQDNSLNGGNQIINTSRLKGYRRINQYSFGNSNYRNSITHYGGYDQGNTGNSGSNKGLNQDNSSNSGNQIVG